MKKISNKFLSSSPDSKLIKDCREYNAKKAEQKVGIPKKLWYEFSNFSSTKLGITLRERKSQSGGLIDTLIDLCFLAGLFCGWAEKNSKIK